MFAGATRFSPSTDNCIQFADYFKFQPGSSAPFGVNALNPLSQYSFQMLFESQLVQLFSFFDFMIRIANGGVRLKYLLQECFAFKKRDLTEVVTVAIKEVKTVIDDRDFLHEFGCRLDDGEPLLKSLEIATSFFIQRHDLTVKPDVMAARGEGDY